MRDVPQGEMTVRYMLGQLVIHLKKCHAVFHISMLFF